MYSCLSSSECHFPILDRAHCVIKPQGKTFGLAGSSASRTDSPEMASSSSDQPPRAVAKSHFLAQPKDSPGPSRSSISRAVPKNHFLKKPFSAFRWTRGYGIPAPKVPSPFRFAPWNNEPKPEANYLRVTSARPRGDEEETTPVSAWTGASSSGTPRWPEPLSTEEAMLTLAVVEDALLPIGQPRPKAQPKNPPKKHLSPKPKAKVEPWLEMQQQRMAERREHFDSTKEPSSHDAKFLYGRQDVLDNFFEADVKRFGAGKQGLRQLASRVHDAACYVEGRPVQVTKTGSTHAHRTRSSIF